MAKNKKKKQKSNKKAIRSVTKEGNDVSKVETSGAKAAEYIENLLELHKLQGVLLVHLQKEFVR
jgi:hypothetical protein